MIDPLRCQSPHARSPLRLRERFDVIENVVELLVRSHQRNEALPGLVAHGRRDRLAEPVDLASDLFFPRSLFRLAFRFISALLFLSDVRIYPAGSRQEWADYRS